MKSTFPNSKVNEPLGSAFLWSEILDMLVQQKSGMLPETVIVFSVLWWNFDLHSYDTFSKKPLPLKSLKLLFCFCCLS